MKIKLICIRNIIIIIVIFTHLLSCTKPVPKVDWPQITTENKPWTRWWWLGNILDEKELSIALREYARAGLGGLEITPIYGVKGYEDQFIDYLSDEWVNKLIFTLKEAETNGLKIDMATGTGWPFGGPWVTSGDACKYMVPKVYELNSNERLEEKIEYIQRPILRTIGKRMVLDNMVEPVAANDSLQQVAYEQVRYEKPLPLLVLMAYNNNGEKLNLTDKVINGELVWTAPEGKWKLYAIFQGWHGKIVERAAPGGEGDVIDHFNKQALYNYLKKFDDTFEGKDISSLRAFFNDSYEVDDAVGEADFTPNLFDEFSKRNGYDLRDYLPAFFGYDTIDNMNIKIIMDYRQTISELLLENFTQKWSEWAKTKGAIIRNQAHGSPANILDLYAAVDIPETEGKDILKIKFASSASNVTGKKLTSSESATWLNEHFLSTLEDTKKNIDRYFLGGVNHIFYHGTTFSPSTEKWPGFMFYASVHYAPTNTFWDDFKSFNHYVARCQSFLQNADPDNDILVYFPYNDRIAYRRKQYLLQHFSGGGVRGMESNFRTLVNDLINKGYSLDYISDNQLQDVKVKSGKLFTGNANYKVIVVPECKYMPLETLRKLNELSKSGALVIFQNNLPKNVPGYRDYNTDKKLFDEILNNLKFEDIDDHSAEVKNGKGYFIKGSDIAVLLNRGNVLPESMVNNCLHYIRKKNKDGFIYFITNWDTVSVNDFVKLNINAASVVLFNPETDEFGLADMNTNDDNIEVFLQLEPGQSVLIRTYNDIVDVDKYKYIVKTKDEFLLQNNWKLTFIKGGPELPESQNVSELFSWTDFKPENYKSFSGSCKYSTNLKIPYTEVDAWLLDLGKVCESARVILNGEELGTLYSNPYQIIIPLKKLNDENTLEIIVSNLMANRIIDMEKKGENYKRFYNVNFPANKRENRGENGLFTAKDWEPLESGLLGPVTLTGIKYKEF